jgi:hypothetical protein
LAAQYGTRQHPYCRCQIGATIRPHQQRQCADANYRHLIYEIDECGRQALRERGLSFLPKSYHHNFLRELMVAQVMASFDLGARAAPNARLISWPEILAHETTPAATRAAAAPATIRVSYELRGVARCDEITADASPFGVERGIEGKRSYLFFPGIEADCGTEPIDAGDPERSSIAKKFCAYLAVAEQGLHRSHFGFPNFFVPFITTSSARMPDREIATVRAWLSAHPEIRVVAPRNHPVSRAASPCVSGK